MGLLFNLTANPTGNPGEEQYVLNVYDQSPGGSTGNWVTHPVGKSARSKVLASVLDILSAIGGCATFEEAHTRVRELWLKHGLDKPPHQ